MEFSIGEAARLLGVSVRTLRYYDEIGLVKPAQTTQAGYRVYDDAAMATLQQALFYRELEFPLRDVADMLACSESERLEALHRRRTLLLLERQRIDSLIELTEKTIGGMQPMKKTEHHLQDADALRAQYAAEAAERWGKTDAYAESEKRRAARSDAQQSAIEEEADAIFAAFAAAMDKGPESPEAQALVDRWQAYISAHYYPCTDQILAGLGQMYVCDERFTANLDRFGDGNAQFISEAISHHCRKAAR